MARPRKTLTIRMGPESKRPSLPQEEVLGRNLAAAFIAAQHGIGQDYARKKHAGEPVGEFWISLARVVMEHFAQNPASTNPSHDAVTPAQRKVCLDRLPKRRDLLQFQRNPTDCWWAVLTRDRLPALSALSE